MSVLTLSRGGTSHLGVYRHDPAIGGTSPQRKIAFSPTSEENFIIGVYEWIDVRTASEWGTSHHQGTWLDVRQSCLRVGAIPSQGVFLATSEWGISHQCGVWTDDCAAKSKALNNILFS